MTPSPPRVAASHSAVLTPAVVPAFLVCAAAPAFFVAEIAWLGWVLLAATIIPIADTAIVLANGGPKSIAWGVHGVTAAVMVATSALLLIS